MRKINGKERRSAGNIYCCYCRPAKVDAVYRPRGMGLHTDSTCLDHKHLLEAKEIREYREDHSEAAYSISSTLGE